jgi:hypothetical protein
MADDSRDNSPTESRGHVLATYREIAERFRLGGPNAARTKVKRAGWTWDPPNHPADPLRIRVPKAAWDQAAEIPDRKPHGVPREMRDGKQREPASQAHESRDDLNGFEMALKLLREQLARERSRAEGSEGRVRDLTEEIDSLREQMTELREARAAAIAKAEAAEAQVDDLKAEGRTVGEGKAEAQAKADLLQVEIDRLRAEAEHLRGQSGVPGAGRRRRQWRFWRRRRAE